MASSKSDQKNQSHESNLQTCVEKLKKLEKSEKVGKSEIPAQGIAQDVGQLCEVNLIYCLFVGDLEALKDGRISLAGDSGTLTSSGAWLINLIKTMKSEKSEVVNNGAIYVGSGPENGEV